MIANEVTPVSRPRNVFVHLARWGIGLRGAMGAVLMSISTIVVAANAQLPRRAPL